MADVKPDVKDPISITLKDSNKLETVFKVKRNTKFSRIKEAYATRMGVNALSIRLMFDGDRVEDADTPERLGLEDGDVIDVMPRADGGGAY